MSGRRGPMDGMGPVEGWLFVAICVTVIALVVTAGVLEAVS